MWLRQSRNAGTKTHPAILLWIATLGFGVASAMASDELSRAGLPQMLEWLDAHHPELAAARQEEGVAEARVQPAGALPDPSLSVEWRDIRYDSPTLDPTQVGSMRYQFRQAVPLWGKRELRTQVARSGVGAAAAQRQQTRLALRRELKAAHAEWVAAQETLRQLEALQQTLIEAERLARARYASGQAAQGEVLRAQTELASLQNERVTAAAGVRRFQARLNALLLRAADAPLASAQGFVSLPERLDWAALTARMLQHNPQLALASVQGEASARTAELTRRNRWPDLTVGVAPMQSGSRFDTWELMLEINLPLQQESRRHQEREAEAAHAAALSRRAATEARLQGELSELRAGYETALHHGHVLENSVLPQIELGFQAAQAAYASGNGDFAALIEAQRSWNRTRMDAINAAREARLALAEIELRTGGEP